MPRKNGRAGHGPAIGTPLAGGKKIARPKRRYVLAIVVGGMLLAWATQRMPGYVPTFLGTTSILAAFIFWNKKDPRLAVTVATWPIVAILAVALAATYKATARNLPETSDTASVTVGGAIWDLGDGARGWLADRVRESRLGGALR